MDFDASSYPHAAPVAQQNPLDTIAKIQGIQQQGITIDRSKLALVNEKYDYSSKYMGGLLNKPDLNEDDLIDAHQHLLNQGIMTPDDVAKENSSIPTMASLKRKNPNATQEDYSSTLRDWTTARLLKHASIMEQLNFAYGTPARWDTGQTTTQGVESQRFGFKPLNAPVQNQVPPTQQKFGPAVIGPNTQIPEGKNQVPGGIPGQFQSSLPVNRGVPSSQARPTQAPLLPVRPGEPQIGEPGLPNERVAQGFNTIGVAPGVSEAATATGRGSGEMLAHDREAAANYQRITFPLEKSIEALETLGTKGTGPGTETFNNIKSFILSNVPGVDENTFNNTVKNFDEAKKYLVDFVNQNGNTGTNDKLAAAFSGNPSVHISNAAATDVAKSALALARMKQATVVAFDRLGLPEHQYARWASKYATELDSRAFGVDKMSKDAKAKLYKELDKKENKAAAVKFDNSLAIAHNLGLVKLQ